MGAAKSEAVYIYQRLRYLNHSKVSIGQTEYRMIRHPGMFIKCASHGHNICLCWGGRSLELVKRVVQVAKETAAYVRKQISGLTAESLNNEILYGDIRLQPSSPSARTSRTVDEKGVRVDRV